jgi:hypothetical protein
MAGRVPIPKTQKQILVDKQVPLDINMGNPNKANQPNRGTQTSFRGDATKPFSVGIEDLDQAIMYYFQNVIKPFVVQNEERIEVPVIYGSPEKWKSYQKDGYYRDVNGAIMAPLIMFKRDNIEKNRTVANKLDANNPHNISVTQKRYSSANAYSNFAVLTNRIPTETYYASVVPDYLTLEYSCVVFTYYVAQLNKIVEAIEYASDSYWGNPESYQFQTRIDSFNTVTELQNDAERLVRSTFNIKVHGYIVPEVLQKDLNSVKKFSSTSKIIINLETTSNHSDFLSGQNATTEAGIFNPKSSIVNTNVRFLDQVSLASFETGPSSTDVTVYNYLALNTVVSGSLLTGSYTSAYPNGTINGTSTATIYNYNTSSVPTGITDTGVMKFNFYINGLYLEPQSIISVYNSGPNVLLTIDNHLANFSEPLDSGDELIGNGKFIAV